MLAGEAGEESAKRRITGLVHRRIQQSPRSPKELQTAAPSLPILGGAPVGGGWHLPPKSTRTQA